MSPAPSTFHHGSNCKLVKLLGNYIDDNNLGWLLDSPVDVILDEFNTVQPDLLFIFKENVFKIEEEAIIVAPDFVVEIISPGSVQKDRHIKKELYERFGVKEYWIVDIKNETVEVFQNNDFHFELFSYVYQKGKILSNLFPELDITIECIFPDFKLNKK